MEHIKTNPPDDTSILLQAELLKRHGEINLAEWIPEYGDKARGYLEEHPNATVDELDKHFFNNNTLH